MVTHLMKEGQTLNVGAQLVIQIVNIWINIFENELKETLLLFVLIV